MMSLLLLIGPAAMAASWTVDAGGSGDFESLSVAVATASSGDNIAVAAGTYTDECIDFAGKDLTINGDETASPKLIQGASDCDNLLVMQSGETVGISGLSLQNADSRVVYLQGGGSLDLTDVTVSGSGNWDGWSGTLWVTGSTLTVTDSIITGNTGSLGGAIYAASSTVTLVGTEISDNDGWYGAIAYLDSTNTLTLEACTANGNWTYYSGGIRSTGGGTITLADSTFSANTLYSGSGGALSVDWASAVTISGSTFVDNQATSDGGALAFYANYATVAISDSVFQGNIASDGYGGALFSQWYPSIEISGSTFTDNYAEYGGGALAVWYDTTLSIEDSEFDGNIAGYAYGGALSFYDGDQSHGVTISGTRFVENSAYTDGGAINLSWVDNVDITGSTFEANTAGVEAQGGAVDMYVVNDVTLHGNRFCRNEAGTGGAVNEEWIYVTDAWTNNLFVENTASYGGARARYAAYVGEVVNNTFVGNRALVYGGVWFADYDYADFRNNVVAHTASGNGLYAIEPHSGSESTLAFDAWHDNAPIDAGGYFSVTADDADAGHVWGDDLDGLGFFDYSFDGDCGNDDLRPAPGSVLIDAGDPDLVDPDGTRSDIGAFGGPGAPVMDWDGDGHDTLTDCNDGDADVHPDADEVCNDIDDDCDGDIDSGASNAGALYADTDGDGFGDPNAETLTCADELSGMVADASDCDDSDASVHPDASEIADDGIDQDCDGEDQVSDVPDDTGESAADDDGGEDGGDERSGCGCSAAPRQPHRQAGLLLLLFGLPLVRRRRGRVPWLGSPPSWV
jgi:MYXO-CTERM domain-containing protein